KIGDELMLGDEVVLKIEQIGKDCHTGCSIMEQAGCCIMPKKGIFASVKKGGLIKYGDRIRKI
ncbi:MAG TPA: MOSC domain-containing protein, partial [Candidatus Omnitrophota bacterium]|nr:MOSC domain-containing protein [Candidatus Omnitrophota bacterium]